MGKFVRGGICEDAKVDQLRQTTSSVFFEIIRNNYNRRIKRDEGRVVNSQRRTDHDGSLNYH